MNKNIFDQIAPRVVDRKYNKICKSLAVKFNPAKESQLWKVYELVLHLYLENEKEDAHAISTCIQEETFKGDFNIWTPIEHVLFLKAKIEEETNKEKGLESTLAKINTVSSYAWGDELKATVNRNVRKRRVEERTLFRDSDIAEAIEEKDKESELDYRLAHFSEQLFIYFLTKNEEPDPVLANEIEENKKQILSLRK